MATSWKRHEGSFSTSIRDPSPLGSAISLTLIRSQRDNTPEDLHPVQHAMLKRLCCTHLRRLTFPCIFQQPKSEGVLMMSLDLSNGHGRQTSEILGCMPPYPVPGPAKKFQI